MRFVSLVLAIAITAAASPGASQDGGGSPAPQASEPSIEKTYDSQRAITTIKLDNMWLAEGADPEIALVVNADFPGREPKGPPAQVTFIFVTFSPTRSHFLPVSLLSMTVDGRILPGRRAVRLDNRVDKGHYIESIASILPREMFADLAAGKVVEFVLHETRIRLTDAHRAGLRNFAAAVNLTVAGTTASTASPPAGATNQERNANLAVDMSRLSDEQWQPTAELAERYQRGDYAGAAEAGARAIRLMENDPALGSQMVVVLNNLGLIYKGMGDYARGEAAFKRAFDLMERSGLSTSTLGGVTLDNLALLLAAKGDYDGAVPLSRRAIDILRNTVGAAHPTFATAINNFATLSWLRGDVNGAVELQEAALAALQRAKGENHPDVATALDNLARMYAAMGSGQGEALAQRALSIYEATLGASHPETAAAATNLALYYRRRGDNQRAEPLYRRALDVYRATLGSSHPELAIPLGGLAEVHEARGDVDSSLQFWRAATDIRERTLSLMLNAGTERQTRAYVAHFAHDVDSVVSLHTRSAPRSAEASRLALTLVLQRKGRSLDASRAQLAMLRDRIDADDRALFERAAGERARLAGLIIAGPRSQSAADHAADVSRLEAEVQRLDAELSERSAQFRAQVETVTLDRVQRALPAGAALVEFVTFLPHNPRTGDPEPRRVVAYVLKATGPPTWSDLGEASAIDAQISEFRRALADPRRADVAAVARKLDRMVLEPLRPSIGSPDRLFLSPDGALNLIPFAALVDESGRYVVEHLSITYLTSGRDLLAAGASAATTAPLIVADPDYENRPAVPTAAADAAPVRLGALGATAFTRLPATAEEAAALKALMPDAQVLLRGDATETNIKRARAPRLLHIATHGFFMAGPRAADDRSRGLIRPVAAAPAADDSFLRSALALAGANNPDAASTDDGILTALEASILDLHGTELVVLSACETGVGDVRSGDGVYGLRRAFLVAGANSQLMSLWQVDDAGTRDLMIDYYRRLGAGGGRSESLRQTQLSMLASESRRHPYYWAAFIQSGDWRPLPGR